MKITLVFAFAVILSILSPSSVRCQAAEPAEWTLMFYMDADNNLEAPQMVDIEEMMKVGSSAKVNLIALIDRSVKGESADERGYTDRAVGGIKPWTSAKYLVIEKGRLREVADWGELNMGDPANLKRFFDETVKQFPARRYGVVFGDHGAGWPGILSDESADSNGIDMSEMPVVLKDFMTKNGKLDLIGFDACLMANFEVARTVAPYAKTMVASEELEPGDGWNYTPLMTRLSQNPAMDSFELGRTVVDTYRDYYFATETQENYVTLSVIDLAKIDALAAAISDLAVTNQGLVKTGGRDSMIKIARARSKASEFGKDEGSSAYNFDIVGLAENIKLQTPASARSADAVIAAAKAAVVYKINGPTHARATGLSIYFPNNSAGIKEMGYDRHPFYSSFKWPALLAEVFAVLEKDTQAPQVQPVETTDKDIAKDDVVQVSAKVNADDIEEATFVLAANEDKQSVIIGSIPAFPDEKGVLHEEWDGGWFTISDGKNQQICPITGFEQLEEGGEQFMIEVPAQIRFAGGKQWRDITLNFVLDLSGGEATGEFVSAFEFVKGNPREIDLEKGDSIRPVFLRVDENGDVEQIASSDATDILSVGAEGELFIGYEDVPAGDYSIGFLVTDFAGNTTDKFVDVTLE